MPKHGTQSYRAFVRTSSFGNGSLVTEKQLLTKKASNTMKNNITHLENAKRKNFTALALTANNTNGE